jgi:hypothetical protein
VLDRITCVCVCVYLFTCDGKPEHAPAKYEYSSAELRLLVVRVCWELDCSVTL